jgi:2-dehydro-3-deoxygluconokinase
MNFDVIALGETMLRLTPPGFQRLEQATSFDIHIGGSESNTAVGLARLGKKVAWLSRLPNNPLGQSVASTIGKFLVDVSHVAWSDHDRLGTYYLEHGKPPRASQVLYDRRDSAMSRMQPGDIPNHLFQANRSRLFHTTGITLGISQSAASTALHAARLAKKAGWLVSFDVNYRGKLWSAADARQGCLTMMQLADLIFLPVRDANSVFDARGEDHAATVTKIGELAPNSTVVMTLGAAGAIARTADGTMFHQAAFPSTDIERLGSGDAFSAGFLSGFLEFSDVQTALRWGAATASIKHTIPGDLPLVHRQEVEALVGSTYQTDIAR